MAGQRAAEEKARPDREEHGPRERGDHKQPARLGPACNAVFVPIGSSLDAPFEDTPAAPSVPPP
jgi:hypothetical protein